MTTKKYVVECWPGRKYTIEAEDEEDAFVKLVVENGWPGGEESTGNGIHFQAWVRESDKEST